MIATGGLLRINARRQDSLRAKPQKAHPPKKKRKNKRSSEVVVVKGKLKLCSLSGLVAVLGILVLVVGGFLAALGYWPRDGLFFSAQPQEGSAMASVSSSSTTPALSSVQEEMWEEEPEGDTDERGGEYNISNQTETTNKTTPQLPQGFFEYFLDRYLYSDSLKVFGPLIMGIGIFLFICANAVLHENRDKKTKVINLRDIYSTVIDVHSTQKPHPPSPGSTHPPSANPLNGLVNYVQSQGLDSKAQTRPTSLLLPSQAADKSGSSDRAAAVFSIYQSHPDALSQSSPNRHSLPQTCSPCWSSQHKEVLTSFTLPRSSQRSPGPRRRHSFWAGSSREDEEQRKEVEPPPLCTSSCPTNRGSKALLLQSSSSLSSLSYLLSSSSSTPAPPCRRQSLPTASISVTYSKLTHKEEHSLEWSLPQEVTLQRRGSSREKMTMMSQRKEEESKHSIM
ncbi:transmembrane protein 200C [Austrofundulus limnaeus]|uniref:Transmembrane protein 200C n=1 Tax=Austrofundulus limnaeus TaxID=52670 RepID=A0A2I4AIX5_AUSLI|nr:PREDICTED: transmembrane protein 200C-like [Austrofundulus limnaeus]